MTTSNGSKVMGFKPAGGPQIDDGTVDTGIANNQVLEPLSIPQTIGTAPNEIELQDYNIDNTGTIIGTYGDGNAYVIGRVALASFANADGLEKTGENMYNASANSGEPVEGGPSDDGFGTIRSGFMEMSNVDLASEFTEMIVATRAYQANSRSITTSDEMLQELINLKR
ncbi:MAG: flagellar hook-basal body complex protein [Alkalibacterium sp.]|nr:flagellar hook-basal body complex protein [Alkalibacterium sp.]